jgi:hypothetical protein
MGAVAVVPRDSAWFSFFDGQRSSPLRGANALYTELKMGLRTMDDAGKLHFEEVSRIPQCRYLWTGLMHLVRACPGSEQRNSHDHPALPDIVNMLLMNGKES